MRWMTHRMTHEHASRQLATAAHRRGADTARDWRLIFDNGT